MAESCRADEGFPILLVRTLITCPNTTTMTYEYKRMIHKISVRVPLLRVFCAFGFVEGPPRYLHPSCVCVSVWAWCWRVCVTEQCASTLQSASCLLCLIGTCWRPSKWISDRVNDESKEMPSLLGRICFTQSVYHTAGRHTYQGRTCISSTDGLVGMMTVFWNRSRYWMMRWILLSPSMSWMTK